MKPFCLTKTIAFDGDVLALSACFSGERHLFLLESGCVDSSRGRYSFIGFDPFFVLRAEETDVLEKLKAYYERYAFKAPSVTTPLSSGVVGYLSYDYGLYQENIKSNALNDLQLPDGLFGFYDVIFTVDHLKKKLHVTSTGLPEQSARLKEIRASARLDYVINKISSLNTPSKVNRDISNVKAEDNLSFQSNFSKEKYISEVDKVLQHIAEGDIYQLNLSQRFHAKLAGENIDPLLIYSILRDLSPAPFSGYFDGGDHQLICSSPERFLSLRDGIVQTRPMKGTRPRGLTPEEDALNEKELCESAKDQAELLMITDLERNDLGRVCEPGSINVKAMRNIEVYKNIFQATSLIEGKLEKDEDVFSLISACFPGGSITGCPKIRAMQIIDELEPTRRGPYTGSLGYIGFDGNADFNILIRTLIKKNQDIYFQAGGGIVADSTGEKEYEETLVKARAMMNALNIASHIHTKVS